MKLEAPAVSFESPELVAAVKVIEGKWKIRITCLLLEGTKRFGELRRLLAEVHRGTLTYELRALEADGIVQRTQYLTIPPTVEYTLTATGAALKPDSLMKNFGNNAQRAAFASTAASIRPTSVPQRTPIFDWTM